MNIAKILNDPSVHDWVKSQYHVAKCRDCLDAANDAELLAAMLRQRCEQIIALNMAALRMMEGSEA